MIVTVCFLLVVASVPLLGGRLSRVGELRFNAVWTIGVALAIQVFVISLIEHAIPSSVAAGLHLLSYALGIVFIWANRRIAGMTILVVGGMLNLVAIAANGGVMPASTSALETAGIPYNTGTFENSGPVEDAAFWFFGDVFAVLEGVPFANVFSIGDVILIVGGAVFLHSTARSRLSRQPAPAAEEEEQEQVQPLPLWEGLPQGL